MSDHTSIVATVNLSTKRLRLSGVMGLRETVDVSLSVAADFPGDFSNWRLYLQKNGVAVAECDTFDADGLGELDLSDTRLVALFADKGPTARVRFLFQLWDETADALIAQDWVYVENNTAPEEDATLTPTGSLVAAVNIAAYQAVRIDQDGKAALSSNLNLSYVAATVGLASRAAAAGALVPIVNRGPVSDAAWNWTPGLPVYLSDAGNLSHAAPAAWPVMRVGVAQSATTLWLTMWPGANGQTGGEGPQGTQGEPGEQGRQGIQGVQGIQGATGATGRSWLSGTVAPVGLQGYNGDFYLNTTDAKVYLKTAGVWNQIANLAIGTDVVSAYVLALLAASFGSLSALDNPTIDDMVTAINATIAKLKGLS